MELLDRLIILKDAGQIDDEIYSKMLKLITLFKDKWNIELTEENGAMLITHLCIALQRIKNKDVVQKLDEALYEEIRKNEYYKKSTQALETMEADIEFGIPECEKDFIMMHLCVLFERENIQR